MKKFDFEDAEKSVKIGRDVKAGAAAVYRAIELVTRNEAVAQSDPLIAMLREAANMLTDLDVAHRKQTAAAKAYVRAQKLLEEAESALNGGDSLGEAEEEEIEEEEE